MPTVRPGRADDRPIFWRWKTTEASPAGAVEFVDDHDLWTVDRHGATERLFLRGASAERSSGAVSPYKNQESAHQNCTFVTMIVLSSWCGELLVKCNDAGCGVGHGM